MNSQTLQQFFAGDKLLTIPHYQRDYAWGIRNIEDLFNDIQESIETNTTHYIGTFILSKKDDEKEFKIVDGQQRLTTLYILLTLLIKGLDDEARRLAYTYVFLLNMNNSKKLVLAGSNGKFFNDLLAGQQPDAQVKSQKRLAGAYKIINKQIAALTQAGRNRWIETIQSFNVIEFVEKDEGKAIRMFQSVNDRGVPLSNMDKAKSLLIYYSNRFLDGALDADINDKFGECYRAYDVIKEKAKEEEYKIDLIDSKTFTEDDIFRYHYLTYKHNISLLHVGFDFRATMDSVLTRYLKPALKQLKDDREYLSKFIIDYAVDLSEFFRAFADIIEFVRKNYRLYHFLVIQKASANIYPLMIRLHQRQLLFSGGLHFLKKLFVVDMRVYKIRGTDPLKDIYYLAHDSFDLPAYEISNRLLNFAKKFMSDSSLLSALQNSYYYQRAGIPSILTELEITEIKDSLYKNDKDMKEKIFSAMRDMVRRHQSVEHILPQTPMFDVNTYGFDNEDDYNECIDKIGNLTLLTESENKSFSNISPDIKLCDGKYYKASFYQSTSKLAYDLCGYGRIFTKDELNNRTFRIAQFCVDKWPLWEGISEK